MRKITDCELPALRADKETLGTNKAVAKKWGVAESTVLYALNPEARARCVATVKRHAADFPELVKQINRRSTQKYREHHRRRVMLQNAKYRAQREGIAFDITEKDVPIPFVCPVLGIPLVKQHGVLGPNSPSIDRIRPTLGYTKGNVVVISHLANRLKSDETDPQIFEAIASYLRKYQENTCQQT